MGAMKLSQRSALIIFLTLAGFTLAMVTWWVILMARLTDEKVDLAAELGASPEYVNLLQEQEVGRQIMVGSEGVVFLVSLLVGVWLIYRSLVQAHQLRRLQENFLMAVTHELKTPLASISLYLDTLQSEKISAERKQQLIPRMKEDLGRLEGLVEDILEAGRFEASAYKPDRQRLDLGKLLNELCDDLPKSNPGRLVRVTRNITDDIYVVADSGVIQRAIRAILDNAVKYSGEADPDLTIILKRLRTYSEITITDRGIGIEKSELVQIFDRFYRVGQELTRACPGTGLGLYLCRQMIRAHGGEVLAQSNGIGHGAEFIITLPMDES
jgi:signal transduction histidine kinase